MAEEDKQDDIEITEDGGSKKKLIIIIIAAVVLILVGVAAMFFLGGDEEKEASAESEVTAPPAAVYYQLPEPITINFQRQSNKKVRLLQIKVALMSYDKDVITSAELNLPMLQDSLTTLFTEQTLESINTVEGRKALQATALQSLNTLLKEEVGAGKLDAVYFTSFILQ
ncbi:MAG: flagellar basal body-associated FliL family protein [Gammaproteobacteria bacterium]|nr:flagellar basal body-associated FliL family protein [Gammaproteobacteria bacterium]MDH5592351.1 flagellar basal body-associated FliL family protein [Gammaproteobacteria bacterium]